MAKKQKTPSAKKRPAPAAPRQSKAAVSPPAKPPLPPQTSLRSNLSAKSEEPDSFIVQGVVTNSAGSPAVGLTVIAFDKDIGGEDRLGEAITDKGGAYEITYSPARFRRSKNERSGADVFVRVYQGKDELLFQSKTKRNAPEKFRLDVNLPAARFVVRGKVTDANQKPLAKKIVRAFERDLRHPQLLGTTTTDAAGGYRIAYDHADFALGDAPSRRTPWLIVEVFEKADGPALARQEVPKAADDQTVSFTLADVGAVSEWQRISEAVAPLLQGQGTSRLEMTSHASAGGAQADLAPCDLTPADVDFIAQDADLDRAAVEAWAASSRMLRDALLALTGEHVAQQKTLGKHGWPFFYGLIRAGLPAKFEELVAVPRAAVERAANRSINEQVVPKIGKQKLRALLDCWDEFRAPLVTAHTDPSLGFPASEILDLLPEKLAPRLRPKVALAIARHGGLNSSAWAELEDDPDLADGSGIATLKKTVSIAGAFSSDPGIRGAVIADVADRKDIQQASDLVRLDPKDWERIVRKETGSDGKAPQVAARARELADQVDRAHFGEAAHVRIERKALGLSAAAAEKYAQLEKANPTMRLGMGSVRLHDALKAKKGAETELPPAVVELLATDTLLEDVGSASDVADLRANGFAHAGAVLLGGRADFEKKMTKNKADGGPDWPISKVQGAFVRVEAAGNSGTFVTIHTDTNRRAADIPATSGAAVPTTSAPANTLSGLMGDEGACACPSCRSVLSQSAYLADLLRFLGDATRTNGKSPLDVLLARRPEVQEVLLDCANDTVEVPYVDLVNEILERAVLNVIDPGSRGMVLAPTTTGIVFMSELTNRSIPGPLRDSLATHGVHLSLAATVEPGPADSYWIIRDERWIVQLFPHFGGRWGMGIPAIPWPQSAITSDSGPAAPLMLMMAYAQLDAAVYPWTLPFDLPAAMITQAAKARGVSEAELIRAFSPGGPADRDAAASLSRLYLPRADLARLGATLTEIQIATRWGFTTVNDTAIDPNPDLTATTTLTGWKSIAARVSFLLARAGLDYDGLVRLLQTQHVNPTGALAITPVDGHETCDARKLKVTGLTTNEDFLRLYDFVRLSRATGLDYRALDILLAAVRQTDLQLTLVGLSDAMELASGLDLPIPHLAVFWGQISTRRYSDTNEVAHVLLPSVYEEWFRRDSLLRTLLPENPNATGATWPTWNDLRTGLSLALGIDSVSLDDWRGVAGIASSNADLDSLSGLLRNVLLARAMGCALEDYKALLDATRGRGLVHPFFSPSATTRFIDQWKVLSDRQISTTWLIAVLKHEGAPCPAMERQWQQAAEVLRQALLPAWDQDVLNRKIIIRTTITQALQLDAGIVDELLTRLIAPADRTRTPSSARQTILDYLAAKSLWPNSGSAAITANGHQSRAIGLLQKAAWVMQGIGLSTGHVGWVLKHAAVGTWLDLNGLPVEASSTASGLPHSAWAKLEAWAAWSQRSAATPESLLAYFNGIAVSGATRAHGNSALGTLTGLEAVEVDLLTVPGISAADLDPVFPVAFWHVDLADRLTRAKALATRLGASSASLANVFTPPQATAGFAGRLLNAATFQGIVRGAVGAEKWAELRREFEKQSRDSRRRALVDYLVGPERVKRGGESFSANDLFERYLIDVEMSPEMGSTRLAQAIFAAQLFVQRGLLRLEAGVTFSENDAKEWHKWRKWFRVWEANRKVFLFPENWQRPEFRDDKSPFFKELESDLAQGDLTTERAISAFDAYLRKFEQVTRLEVVSLLNAGNTTHLVARTSHGPVAYYYRTRTKSTWATWTPWERIDTDVQGDFVFPIVQDGRVQVVWPEITEGATGAEGSAKQWQIQVARSRRTNDGWAPKETIGTPIRHPKLPDLAVENSFAFRATRTPANELKILAFGAMAAASSSVAPEKAWSITARSPGDTVNSLITIYVSYMRGLATDQPTWLQRGTIHFISTGTDYGVDHSLPITSDGVRWNSVFGIQNVTLEVYNDSGARLPWRPFPAGGIESEPTPWEMTDGEPVLQVNMNENRGYYVLLELMIPAPPTNQVSPPRIIWSQIDELIVRTSGRIERNKALAGASLKPPTNSEFAGMGYEPLKNATSNLICLSDSPSALPVFDISYSAAKSVRTIGTVQDGFGLSVPGSLRIPKLIGSSEHLALGSPFVVSTQQGSYLVDHPQLLIARTIQSAGADPDDTQFLRRASGDETANMGMTIGREGIEFDYNRAGANYCWEIFLHIPWLIAVRLNENKRFAEAQKWLQLIFDPTAALSGTTSTLDAWRCRPIREALARNETLLDVMADRPRLERAVALWEQQPFQPFAIARTRLRAFAIAVLKDYIVNLVDWGDNIAQRNTMEAFNEATQFYMLAAKLLGSPGAKRIDRGSSRPETYSRLGDFDPFSNPAALAGQIGVSVGGNTGQGLPVLDLRYFCIPENEELQDLWARVEGRLARVRSGLGVSLFGPPIDPALLVRAAAAGLDMETLLQKFGDAMPPYRYSVVVQKAMEFCNEVKALGSALLSAIEKHDSESLGLLRASQEKNLAKLQRDVRALQLAEVQAARHQLETVRTGAIERLTHFRSLMDLKSLPVPGRGNTVPRIEGITKVASGSFAAFDTKQLGLSVRELQQLEWMNVANNYALIASGISSAASIAHIVPNITATVGLAGVAQTGVEFGGTNVGLALNAVGEIFRALSTNAGFQASAAGTVGSHERRRDEWAYQHNVIAAEIEQLDKQLLGADIRVSIATAELTNHDTVIANSQAVEDFMKTKFSNQNLYYWMTGQLSGTYFRAYQMALELATTAQRTCSLELKGNADAFDIVKLGYWDGLKQGLLTGEQLALDLRRLEATYLKENTRELEITKHVSLAQLNPLQLIELRITGSCTFTIPEVLLDLDYPDHYKRRIKSVSVSLPCVVGPYAGIAGTLTMTASKTRLTDRGQLVPDNPPLPDDRSRIAVSGGQGDSGLFETNLRDERYLPFEGAGVAESTWVFDLAREFPAFDRETISDLVMHIRYTALADGTNRSTALVSGLNAIASSGASAGMWRTFSLRHEFASVWQQMITSGGGDLAITWGHFGYFLRGRTLTFKEIKGAAFLRRSRTVSLDDIVDLDLAIPPGATTRQLELTATPTDPAHNHVLNGSLPLTPAIQINQATPELKLHLALRSGVPHVPPADIEDIFLSMRFTL